MQHVRPARWPTQNFPNGKRMRWKIVPFLCGALLLTGCASTRVERLSVVSSPAISAPSSLAVSVTLSPELETDPAAGKVAQALQADLVKYYGKAGLQAFVSSGEPAAGTAALVRVQINHADRGSRAARLLIGFGAGRSALKIDVTIEVTGRMAPAMTFSASAKSGRKPGMIVPGTFAAVTGEVYRLAIGAGTGLLAETGSDLKGDAARSAKLIVKQTRELYRTSGWAWPSDGSDRG